MTKEQAIEELEILKEDYWDDDGYGHETEQYKDTIFALDMAINALENQCPSKGADCEDCPAIQPKAKVGKWIRWHEEITTDNGVIEYKPHCKCSECNKEYDSYSTRFMNYCPNCGAEMQEVEE